MTYVLLIGGNRAEWAKLSPEDRAASVGSRRSRCGRWARSSSHRWAAHG
jgi:hypothetical protein